MSQNGLHHFQNGEPTYIHSDNTSFSEIDYILCNAKGKELERKSRERLGTEYVRSLTSHIWIKQSYNKGPYKTSDIDFKTKMGKM